MTVTTCRKHHAITQYSRFLNLCINYIYVTSSFCFQWREIIYFFQRLTQLCFFYNENSLHTWLFLFLGLLVFLVDASETIVPGTMPVLRKINVFNLTKQSALPKPERAETKHSCPRGQHRRAASIFQQRSLVWNKAGMDLQIVQERMYYFKTLHICPGIWTMAFLKA